MSTNADALDAVKRARAERDAARARLYALELQRIAAEKAQRREQRGEGEIDPAVADEVRDLQAELVRLEEQLRKSDQGDVPRDERDGAPVADGAIVTDLRVALDPLADH